MEGCTEGEPEEHRVHDDICLIDLFIVHLSCLDPYEQHQKVHRRCDIDEKKLVLLLIINKEVDWDDDLQEQSEDIQS